MKRDRLLAALFSSLAALACCGCTTSGSAWMSEPETADDAEWKSAVSVPLPPEPRAPLDKNRFQTRVIGGEPEGPAQGSPPVARAKIEGRVLGTFRNTYYDFPAEPDFEGEPIPVRDAKCGAIAQVSRGFFEALCVQGSGTLRSGRTVSFAKRGCECAEVCPRTGQKICFESLDPRKFPWGRGALGTAIIPLVTVAVDDMIIPMGTPLYVPEFDGVPVDAARTAVHDGCFIAQDRGLRVKGEHLDVFTGDAATTKLWNRLVPSNHGITVILDSPHCRRAEAAAGGASR